MGADFSKVETKKQAPSIFALPKVQR
jgi:hypothetical protein